VKSKTFSSTSLSGIAPARASSLSNELIILEQLLKERGAKDYSLTFLTWDDRETSHTYDLTSTSAKYRRIPYPPLSNRKPTANIKYIDSSGKLLSFDIECKNWKIYIESISLNVAEGWILKPSNFCIRPFLIRTNSQECTYGINAVGERRDVTAIYPNYKGVGYSIQITLSIPIFSNGQDLDLCYSYDDQSNPEAFLNAGPGHYLNNKANVDVYGNTSLTNTVVKFQTYSKAIAPRSVAVLMPVYDGYDETLRALSSFSRYFQAESDSTRLNIRFIIGLDNPRNLKLNKKINEKYSNRPLFSILANERNLGFIGNCNKLFAEVDEHEDILLVNSDIIAPNSNWIERLIEHLDSDPLAGTVTPLSNQASIYSFPIPNQQQKTIGNLSVDEIDAILSQVNTKNKTHPIETPSCHGFCTLIAHSRLKLKYLFDEAYGRGYGEENDLSCRVILAGMRNIAAPNIYVFHHESISFSIEKEKLINANLEKLNAKYPQYHSNVDKYCRLDPLRQYRNKAILYYIKSHANQERTILHVSHFRGGGTDKFVRDFVDSNPGMLHLGLRPCLNILGHVELFVLTDDLPLNHQVVAIFTIDELFPIKSSIEPLLCLKRVILHSLIDFLPHGGHFSIGFRIKKLFPVEIVVHDYHWLNSRENLLDCSHRYRGPIWTQAICDIDSINSALHANKDLILSENIISRIKQAKKLFESAEKVIFPSQSARDIVHKCINLCNVNDVIQAHDKSDDFAKNLSNQPCLSASSEGEILKVAVIGAIGKNKGFNSLIDLASYISQKNMPIRIILIGYSIDDQALLNTGIVSITGKYQDKDFPLLANQHNVLCSLFLSQWPETYSYTLSLAFENRLYPFSYGIGAQAGRIRETGFGFVLRSTDPFYISNRLMEFRTNKQ
jgi:GT2 family glycosyltransferase